MAVVEVSKRSGKVYNDNSAGVREGGVRDVLAIMLTYLLVETSTVAGLRKGSGHLLVERWRMSAVVLK